MDIMNRFKYVLVLLCGLYASCTKYDTPESIAGGIEDTAASKKRCETLRALAQHRRGCGFCGEAGGGERNPPGHAEDAWA